MTDEQYDALASSMLDGTVPDIKWPYDEDFLSRLEDAIGRRLGYPVKMWLSRNPNLVQELADGTLTATCTFNYAARNTAPADARVLEK